MYNRVTTTAGVLLLLLATLLPAAGQAQRDLYARADPGRSDPGRSDPGRSDPGRTDYARIDAVALNVPPEALRTPQALADYLASQAQNDREKARALYRWMTSNIDYDTKAFFSKRPSPSKTADVLRARRAVCEGFATFYQEVGELMGLETAFIRGYAKGYGIRAGQRFSGTNHTWNAVRLDGNWYLVDPTWGGGYIEGRDWTKVFQESYFLVPAELAIFSHLPQEPRWQLTSRPISLAEFERQQSVPRAFFAFGVQPEAVRQEIQAQGRRFRGFVESFEVAGREVRLESAPLGRYLSGQNSYSFALRIPEATEVVLGAPGHEWNRLSGEGGAFRTEATLAPGTWQVFVKFAGEESHRVVLQYTVE